MDLELRNRMSWKENQDVTNVLMDLELRNMMIRWLKDDIKMLEEKLESSRERLRKLLCK